MKAYKRQKLAMLALVATMGIMGLTNASFASSLPSVSVSDIGNKPVVTKMHKDTTLDVKQKTKVISAKRHIKKATKKISKGIPKTKTPIVLNSIVQ